MSDRQPRSFVRKARKRPGDSDSAPSDDAQPAAGDHIKLDRMARRSAGNGERARLVVPRQARGEPRPSELDIELREVRYGATARQAYLRVVPRQRQFTRVASGHIEATRLGSKPKQGLARVLASVRGVLLGSPIAASQAIHERLSVFKALAVIGSDPLSSSAYATEEALVVLALAGASALVYSVPIAAVVAALLITVVISYRQTIKAYPSGGGAYIVAHENLGPLPGLVAAAALIVDYVLLVSVSIAAGVAAITSAFPELYDVRVELSVLVIVFFTLANLRGVRESGSIFAAPTYYFIVFMAVVIVAGFVKVVIGDAPGTILDEGPPIEPVVATQGLTLWLVLRAFSSGSAALTGVEAIANGVPTMKPPEPDNARRTLTMMAIISVFLFLGITFLASRYGLVPDEDETIVSQLGREVLGKNVVYYAFQAGTALVLFLAANTSFNAFPLLSAILAKDKYMPRSFAFRGDRLAYSNGVLVLSGAAMLLVVIFQADVTHLIPLYAVGVFVSFTLSQTGMVRHWLKVRDPGWQTSLAINAVGGAVTAVVALIIGATKLTGGAWISMLMMAGLVVLFWLISRHYRWFAAQIRVLEDRTAVGVPSASTVSAGPPRDHMIVPVDDVNKISLGAVGLAREVSAHVTAVHITDDRAAAKEFHNRWRAFVPDVPLIVIESPYRAFVAPLIAYVEHLAASEPGERITVILPTIEERHWWERFLHNRDVQRVRPLLKDHPEVDVVDFRYTVGAS